MKLYLKEFILVDRLTSFSYNACSLRLVDGLDQLQCVVKNGKRKRSTVLGEQTLKQQQEQRRYCNLVLEISFGPPSAESKTANITYILTFVTFFWSRAIWYSLNVTEPWLLRLVISRTRLWKPPELDEEAAHRRMWGSGKSSRRSILSGFKPCSSEVQRPYMDVEVAVLVHCQRPHSENVLL